MFKPLLCHDREVRNRTRLAPRLLSTGAFAILIVLVAYPALSVLVTSVQNQGEWSLDNYLTFLRLPSSTRLIYSSLAVSLGSALSATILGTISAVLVVKTRAPIRKLLMLAGVLPIILPGFVTAIAYIFLFGRNGLITYKLLGINWDVYSWKSVFILQCVDQTTTAFLMMAAVLFTLGSRMEEAARILGASEWKILWTITLKLARPMLMAAFLLNFMHAMGDFVTPLIVGGPFDTLASASYIQLIGRYDLSMAATYNVILLLISLAVYGWYSQLEKRGRADELSWHSGSVGLLQLQGWWARICWLIAFAFFLFMLALLCSVFLAAFTRQLGSNYSFTIEHFQSIGRSGLSSTVNTIIFASAVGLCTSLLGQILAFLIVRMEVPGKKGLDFLATIPFALPGTFVGVGYAIAFNFPPLLLTGTWFIVVFNLVMRKLPLGLRTGSATLARLDSSLDEASLVLGSSLFRTFMKISLPNLKPAMIVCSLYAFVTTIQALGSIIFIITPGTKLLSVDVFEAVVRGDLGVAAAYSIIMLLIGGTGGILLLSLISRCKMATLQTAIRVEP
jgi:iron(III) transport system permease protein